MCTIVKSDLFKMMFTYFADMELGAEDDGITGSHSGGHSVKKQITIKLKPASGKNARLRNRKPRNNRQAIRNSQDDLLLEQAGSGI